MGKYVEIEKDGTKYTLAFDRASVQKAESIGFSIEEFGQKPMSDYMMLVRASLFKNHSDMTSTEAEDFADFLLNEGYGMLNISTVLMEMYNEVFQFEGRKGKEFKAITTKLKAVE